MTLKEIFTPVLDTENTRTCGTCGNQLDVSKFYKDGTDRDGKVKYRRDCKDCFRKTRLTERRNKRKPVPVMKGGKRK